MLKYKNTVNLGTSFTPELRNHLMDFSQENNLSNYWCIVQFIVTKQNYVVNIVAHSNYDLITNEVKQYISTLSDFEATKPADIAENCAVYICIYCENGKIIIPDYAFNSSEVIMNLLPEK
jgi:hypothetical protein